MAESEDDLIDSLAAVAARAAPSTPAGAHVDESELDRIRRGDDDAPLEASYRHLAQCAACRARLAHVARVEAGSANANRELGEAPRRSRPRTSFTRRIALAAAAVALIGLGYTLTRESHIPGQLAVMQRPYAGLMGEHASTDAARGNTNLELSFVADSSVRAFIVPCNDGGELSSSPHWFVQEGSRHVAVLAPRTFWPRSAKVFGFVVWGSERATGEVAAALGNLATTKSLTATEEELTKRVRQHGAHMQRLLLELR